VQQVQASAYLTSVVVNGVQDSLVFTGLTKRRVYPSYIGTGGVFYSYFGHPLETFGKDENVYNRPHLLNVLGS
jgi:hypothetical protein